MFEGADVDVQMFQNDTMKNIKRTVRKYGKPLGHRKGVNGKELGLQSVSACSTRRPGAGRSATITPLLSAGSMVLAMML